MIMKNDRRSIRTRRQLWEALIALIQEKDYSEITIQEIADRADVNRVTFYLHYKDKHDLLLNNVNAMLDELISKIEPLTRERFRMDEPPESMIQVFQYLTENARFFKIILGEKGISLVTTRLRKYLAALVIQRLEPAADTQPRVSMEALSQYAAGSLLGLIAWWLENDMPISPEEIAHQVLLLTAYGVYWGAGITPPEI